MSSSTQSHASKRVMVLAKAMLMRASSLGLQPSIPTARRSLRLPLRLNFRVSSGVSLRPLTSRQQTTIDLWAVVFGALPGSSVRTGGSKVTALAQLNLNRVVMRAICLRLLMKPPGWSKQFTRRLTPSIHRGGSTPAIPSSLKVSSTSYANSAVTTPASTSSKSVASNPRTSTLPDHRGGCRTQRSYPTPGMSTAKTPFGGSSTSLECSPGNSAKPCSLSGGLMPLLNPFMSAKAQCDWESILLKGLETGTSPLSLPGTTTESSASATPIGGPRTGVSTNSQGRLDGGN